MSDDAMHSVNLDQSIDTEQLKLWLKAGETVELREEETILGRIVPKEPSEELEPKQPKEWPDFAARRRTILGDRIFEENAVLEARKDSRY